MLPKLPGSIQYLATLALVIVIFDPYRSSLPGLNVPLLAAVALVNLQLAKVVYFKRQPEPEARRRALGHFGKAARIAGLLCAACIIRMAWELGVSYSHHAASVLADPLPLNAMEGRETVKAWLMAHGQNIYPSMQSHPFLVTIYPPVYHAAIVAASALNGWGIAAGRLMSLGSLLAVSVTAGWWTWAATRSRLGAVGVLLLMLFDPVLAEWSLHARPDMLAWTLALAGAGVFWAAAAPERSPGRAARGDRLAVASGALLCLAFFTKQQTLPYILGCMIWGLGKGRAGFRPVMLMGLSAAGLGAALAGGLELASGGYFLRDAALYPKMMGALPSVTTMENLIARLGQVWNHYSILWTLFAACLGWSAWSRRWDLPTVLAVVNAAFMVKLLASWGADVNYAFGTVLAALMAVGLLLGALARTRPYGLGVVLALLFVWLPRPGGHTGKPVADVSRLAGIAGTILVNTEGGHLFLGERPGRNVVFFDGIETQLFEQTGLWRSDDSALVQDIRDRRFDRLVFYGSFMPPGVADAAAIFYTPVGSGDHYAELKPSPAGLIAALSRSGRGHVSGPARITEVDMSTLHAETEGLAPMDRKRPGVLRFRVESDKPLGTVQTAFSLRVDPKDPASAASYRLLDGDGRTLATSAASRNGRSDVALDAETPGAVVELVVVLAGNAWVEPKHGALAVLNASN